MNSLLCIQYLQNINRKNPTMNYQLQQILKVVKMTIK
jgi:hypothetical protein